MKKATLLLFLLFGVMVGTEINAQSSTPEIIYKFSVKKVFDPIAAKPVQVLLVQESTTITCYFVDEADVFKLTSSAELTYEQIQNILTAGDFMLSGKVEVSDGTVLKPAITPYYEK